MTIYNLTWAVVLLPLGAALFSYVVESGRRAAAVAVAGTALSLVVAAIELFYRLAHLGQNPHLAAITFWTYSPGQEPYGVISDLHPQFGILVDGLSAVLMPAVAATSLAVQLWSLRYLRGDAGVRRFHVIAAVVTAASLAVVCAPNLLQVLVMSEVAGIGTVLLVGHWWHRPEVADAARRVFLLTRVGDLCLLLAVAIGILKLAPDVALLPATAGQDVNDPTGLPLLQLIEWPRLAHLVVPSSGTRTVELLACLFLVAGLSRLGQLPFSAWPRAAATGPTPALAVALAVTAVPTGTMVLLRTAPLLHLAPHVLSAAALVGAGTLVALGLVALVETDVKRVVAALAVAEAALAVVGIALGAPHAAALALVTGVPAVAAMLVAVGAVVSGWGTTDLRHLGGVSSRMPRTVRTLAIAGVVLAGLPPAGSFWVGVDVLAAAYRNSYAGSGHVASAVQVAVIVLVAAGLVLVAAAAVRLVAAVRVREVHRRRGFVADRVREVAPALLLPGTALALAALVAGLAGIEGLRWNLSRMVVTPAGDQGFSVPWAAVVTALVCVLAGGAAAAARLRLPALAPAAAWFGLPAAAQRVGVLAFGLAPVVARAETRVLEPVATAGGDALALATAAVESGPRRPALRLLALPALAVAVAASVLLAVTGHLPRIGGAG